MTERAARRSSGNDRFSEIPAERYRGLLLASIMCVMAFLSDLLGMVPEVSTAAAEHLVALDDGDGLAQLGRLHGRTLAAGAAADNDQVVFRIHNESNKKHAYRKEAWTLGVAGRGVGDSCI